MRRCLVILCVLAACHGKRAGKDYFGTQVSPPGVLAQIRPGMTLAQVKTIAPDAKTVPGKGLLLATPASNVKLYAIMDGDLVEYTYAHYEAEDGMAVLVAAWGPPDKEPDRGDLHNTVWRSTATGWRASVFCGNGTDKVKLPPFCTIEFHPHLPIEMMFTKGAVTPPGDLAKATPRMTVAQLKAMTHLSQLTDKPIQTTLRWLAYDGAVEHLGIDDGRLFSVDYTVPDPAYAAMEKAWGQPVEEGDDSIWFDAKTGWSATVAKGMEPHEFRLAFAGYQPFLAEIEVLESLAAAPTAADAKRSHPELEWDPSAKSDDEPVLLLRDNEYTAPLYRLARILPVALYGNSVAVRAVMGQLDPAKEAAIVDALTQKWGAPKKTTQSDGVVEYRFSKHGVVLREGNTLDVHVGPDA